MKTRMSWTVFIATLVSIVALNVRAQVPAKMYYQAVLFDPYDRVLDNRTVGLQLSIIRRDSIDTVVYSETHTTTTNTSGLASIVIGDGTPISGSLSDIDWSTGSYFLQVKWDPNGDTNYILSNTAQLLSVPYAFYAQTVEEINDADTDPTNELQTLAISGNQLSISDGNTVTLPIGAQKVDDLIDGNSNRTGSSIYVGLNAGAHANDSAVDNTAMGYNALYKNTIGGRNVAFGSNALYSNTTGYANIAIGSSALYSNTTGYRNIAIGPSAMHNLIDGRDNIAIGTEALSNSTWCQFNLAIGHYALYSTTTGSSNIGIGYRALYANSTGGGNIAVGESSLENNTEGFGNIAIGSNALKNNTFGENNIAVGYQAMHDNTKGTKNAALGYSALLRNTTGNSNTAIGYKALSTNTIGSYNTAIGFEAYSSCSGCNNTISIGYNARPPYSNYAHFGNSSITWIGGQVPWSIYSDQRIKRNISDDVHGLDFILRLRPVTYYIDKDLQDSLMGVVDNADYPEKYDIEKIKFSGFLAQEVEAAARAVGYDFSGLRRPKHDSDLYSLSYASFVVPLVKAVQEQQTLIDRQEDLIHALLERKEQALTQIQQHSEKIHAFEADNKRLTSLLLTNDEKIQAQTQQIHALQREIDTSLEQLHTLEQLSQRQQQWLQQLEQQVQQLKAELAQQRTSRPKSFTTAQQPNQP